MSNPEQDPQILIHEEAKAVIAYGIAALAGLFVFAAIQGATVGMACAVLAAGGTYIFQAIQLARHEEFAQEPSRLMLDVLQGLIVVAWIVGFLAAILGV